MPLEASETENRSSVTLNDDDLAKARTRVSRACTRCRTRKDRCDGQRPTCSACAHAQKVCTYEPATKKRGLPEGYVRGLEKLFALLIGKVEGFEDVTSKLLEEHRIELSRIWNHTAVGEDLHSTWKESKIIHELEGLLSKLDQGGNGAGHKRKREQDDDGSDAATEPDLTFHIKKEYSLRHQNREQDSHRSDVAQDTDAPAQMPQDALQLLDHYFAHTHCWFPVVSRPQVTRACYELVRGRGQEHQQSSAPLLWAILAYTSCQLGAKKKPATSGSHAEVMSRVQDRRSRCLSLIPSDIQDCGTVHAQAYLVIALLDIGLDKWRAAWGHVGQAIRIVLMDNTATSAVARVMPGLLQGCTILDIVIACHLGSVPHLRRADMDTMPLMNEDTHEEWESWNAPQMANDAQREPSFAISCFNRLTEIFLIVSDVLKLRQSIGRSDRAHIQALLAKLHQLQATFPGQMPPSSQSPPHQIYLQLCHVSAQIHLVDLPVDTGAGANERAKLACNVLSLLALCKNTSAIGLDHVPPFLASCVEATVRLATTSRSSFGPVTGLPSYEDFYRTADEFLVELSGTWTVYSDILRQHRSNSQAPSRGSAPFTPSPGGPMSAGIDRLRSSAGFLQGGSPIETHGGRLMTAKEQRETTAAIQPEVARNMLKFSAVSIDQPLLDGFGDLPPILQVNNASIPQRGQGLDMVPNTFDFGMDNNDFSQPLGLAMPETSPSFQGDEIDAIFHEMAHLDTNEWTDERAHGLKEFGFADDLTFQAFCNDPERLLAPLGGAQQLSSSSQTWTFTGSDLDRT